MASPARTGHLEVRSAIPTRTGTPNKPAARTIAVTSDCCASLWTRSLNPARSLDVKTEWQEPRPQCHRRTLVGTARQSRLDEETRQARLPSLQVPIRLYV